MEVRNEFKQAIMGWFKYANLKGKNVFASSIKFYLKD